MSILKKLLNLSANRKSARVARERLQIVVSHQRTEESGNADFLPKLRHELLTVICKYVKVDKDQVNVQLQRNNNCSVLELNITLPDQQMSKEEEELKVF